MSASQPDFDQWAAPHPAALSDDERRRRALWRQSRAAIEDRNVRSNPAGEIDGAHSEVFRGLLRIFELLLKSTGLYRIGARNALDISLRQLELDFPDLPAGFDGYRILHITDLHLDALDGLAEAVRDCIIGCEAELCLITGDYREHIRGPWQQILPPMKIVLSEIDCADGIYATLGNHDELAMVSPLEDLGLRVLANEWITLERGGGRLHVTGLDDPHRFYTPAQIHALDSAPDGFRICAAHSPELADAAARSGYALYLCGHTHGGQISLPGGRPILTKLFNHRSFSAGLWRCRDMIGYTSPGAGVCGTPVRYFTRPEVTLITLRRKD